MWWEGVERLPSVDGLGCDDGIPLRGGEDVETINLSSDSDIRGNSRRLDALGSTGCETGRYTREGSCSPRANAKTKMRRVSEGRKERHRTRISISQTILLVHGRRDFHCTSHSQISLWLDLPLTHPLDPSTPPRTCAPNAPLDSPAQRRPATGCHQRRFGHSPSCAALQFKTKHAPPPHLLGASTHSN